MDPLTSALPPISSKDWRETPLRLVGTTKTLIPFAPLSGSVLAKTNATSAAMMEVMPDFSPLSIYLSPFLTAVDSMAAESVPQCGSVKANAGIISPAMIGLRNFSFTVSVPCSIMQQHNSAAAKAATLIFGSPFPNSSLAIPWLTQSAPNPPSFGETFIPIRPSPPSFFHISWGKHFSLSHLEYWGRTSFWANFFTASAICICSLVKPNSITKYLQ